MAPLLVVAFVTAMFAPAGTAVGQDELPPENPPESTPAVSPPTENPTGDAEPAAPETVPAEPAPAETSELAEPAAATETSAQADPAAQAEPAPAETLGPEQTAAQEEYAAETPNEDNPGADPGPVDGVGNESGECVGLSCNSGNVANIEVAPGCIIIVAGFGAANFVTGDGQFGSIDENGEVTYIDPAGVDVDEFLEDAIIINDVCNTTVNVMQEQIFKAKKIIKMVKAAAPTTVAAGKLPKTGVPAPALGLLGSALATAGVAFWKRRKR